MPSVRFALHDSLLRDRSLLGILYSGTRNKLLQLKKLITLSPAIDICKSTEETTQQLEFMTENPDEVLALKGTSNDRARHRFSRGARTSTNLIRAVVNTAEEHTREVASFVLLLAKRARNVASRTISQMFTSEEKGTNH